MTKLHFHGQDYEDPEVEWQVTEGEVDSQESRGTGSVGSRGEQHPIPQAEGEKSDSKQLTWKTIADDELREASIRQRVRKLENNLFDEYWDEIGAVQASMFDATRTRPKGLNQFSSQSLEVVCV